MANAIYENWVIARDAEQEAWHLNHGKTALNLRKLAEYFEELMLIENGMSMCEYALCR